jgi:hypothetical protein
MQRKGGYPLPGMRRIQEEVPMKPQSLLFWMFVVASTLLTILAIVSLYAWVILGVAHDYHNPMIADDVWGVTMVLAGVGAVVSGFFANELYKKPKDD